MDTILVTGATGNVGLEATRLLGERGAPVRAAVRNVDSARRTFGPAVECVTFDFADPASYQPALRGVRRVLLVRPPAVSDAKRMINPFVDAAAAAGVEQVVFLSLLGAERNRFVPHHAIESHLRTAGVGWTFLRAGFFMQNLSTTHRDDIREHQAIILPAGHGKTSFIDARDIAAVAVRTLTEPGHAGHAYPLTGAQALSYDEVAAVFSRVLGRPIAYRPVSAPGFARHMHRRGYGLAHIAVMIGIYTTTRLGMAATVTPESGALLGRPPTNLATFVADHCACWA